jgi:hypothetical protein
VTSGPRAFDAITARRLVAPLPVAVDLAECVTGWATVELDRAEAELAAAASRTSRDASAAAPDDVILGARCRVIRRRDAAALVLLEPSTEGRLAAALARFGEGPVALYVPIAAGALGELAAAGVTSSRDADGPFGPERLVLGGPHFGPYVIAVERSADRGLTSAGVRSQRVPSVP